MSPRTRSARTRGTRTRGARTRRARGTLATSLVAACVAGLVGLALSACTGGAQGATYHDEGAATQLRLGYFANVTHAPALVGVAEGTFAKELGGTRLSTQVFKAGPAAIEALNAGSIDAAFVGPGPALNDYVQSHGDALRIVAGANAGGAELVVQPSITSAADLRGKDLASPQLGGSQDVALRTWLTTNGLKNTVHGGGDVTIAPTGNAQTLQLFTDHQIDGAWVPEPWASRLVLEGGGHVLVNENDLWPGGAFPTTVLVVSRAFLAQHPETVTALVRGEIDALTWITDHPDQAPQVVSAQIERLSGETLSDAVIARAWQNITPTIDPLASTLQTVQDHAIAAGTARPASIDGIVDLSILNSLRRGDGLAPLSAAGLDRQ